MNIKRAHGTDGKDRLTWHKCLLFSQGAMNSSEGRGREKQPLGDQEERGQDGRESGALTWGLQREGRCCQTSGMLGHEQELVPSVPPSAAGLRRELSGEHCPELAAAGWDGWDGWDGCPSSGEGALPPWASLAMSWGHP